MLAILQKTLDECHSMSIFFDSGMTLRGYCKHHEFKKGNVVLLRNKVWVLVTLVAMNKLRMATHEKKAWEYV